MIGVLYESDEWSDWKLHDELLAVLGEPVAMIDMEEDGCVQRALSCELLVSRVFASAVFRGHARAAENMLRLVGELERAGEGATEMINPPCAHQYEVSKAAVVEKLAPAGLDVPRVLDLGRPGALLDSVGDWAYPCIVKPDCGGRTTHTAVLWDAAEARAFLKLAPDLVFIVEEYLRSRGGFITRIELVDGEIALAVKRSVASSGLSSYHEGSTYDPYPDVPMRVQGVVLAAGRLLGIEFGSFDVVETAGGGAFTIDANSVSNVSEDCTELFGIDLMREYATAIARRVGKDWKN